jgi:hypothetical protein
MNRAKRSTAVAASDAAVGIAVSYAAIFWLQLWFADAAGHAHGTQSWWSHWLRVGTLAIPVVVGAIVAARGLLRWVAARHARGAAAEVIVPATAAALGLGLASPLHPLLAGQALAPLSAAVPHAMEIGVVVLPVTLLVTVVSRTASLWWRARVLPVEGGVAAPPRLRPTHGTWPVLAGGALALGGAAVLQVLQLRASPGAVSSLGWLQTTLVMAPFAMGAMWLPTTRVARRLADRLLPARGSAVLPDRILWAHTSSRASQQDMGTPSNAVRRSAPAASAVTSIMRPRRRRCLAAGSEMPVVSAITRTVKPSTSWRTTAAR